MSKPQIGIAGKPLGVDEVVDSNGTVERHIEFLTEGGVAPVVLRMGALPPEAYSTDEVDYSAINPDLDVESVQRQVDSLEAKLGDFTGYDRQGQPIYTLQGRERFIAEQELGTLTHLTLPYQKREAARIRQLQQAQVQEREARAARILEAAQTRAREISEAEEIEATAIALAKGGFR